MSPERAADAASDPLRKRRPWEDAGFVLGLFLGSKLLVVLTALVASLLVAPGDFSKGRAAQVGWTTYFMRWDAAWYVGIAEHGYSFDPEKGGSVAFFPLFPLLMRLLGACGMELPTAGLLIANLCFLGALGLFHRLVLDEFGREPLARHATAMFAFSPGVAWFTLGYTEGLFLLLAIGMFLAARRGLLPAAISLGVLVGLCRPNAIVLAAPLAAAVLPAMREAWRERRFRTLGCQAAATASPLLGHAAYLLYLQLAFGDWRASQIAQAKGWDAAVTVNWEVLREKIPTVGLRLFDRPEVFREYVSWSWLIALFAVAFALVALWEGRARPWHAVLLVATMGLYLFIRQLNGPVYSIGRFAAQLFPIYTALALFAEQRAWARPVTLAACTGLATVTTLLLFAGYHVN